MSSLSRDLSDLGPLFQVIETHPAQVVAKSVQLAQPNPLRWAIMISPPNNTGSYLFVSTMPGIVEQQFGFAVGGSPGGGGADWKNLILGYREVGPLVQQAWYGGGPDTLTNGVWTVIEAVFVPGAQ